MIEIHGAKKRTGAAGGRLTVNVVLQVAVEAGHVLVKRSDEIVWLALPPKVAEEFGMRMLQGARESRGEAGISAQQTESRKDTASD